MNAEIHKADVGTKLRVTILNESGIVDLSSASLKTFYLRKPVTGTVLTKTPVFVTDGVDGRLQYVTVAGDLDEAGIWDIQARITISSGGPWSTNIGHFTVADNIV